MHAVSLLWNPPRDLFCRSVQALCKSSGASLGYGFPTMDLDDEDVPEFGESGLPEQPLAVAVP